MEGALGEARNKRDYIHEILHARGQLKKKMMQRLKREIAKGSQNMA